MPPSEGSEHTASISGVSLLPGTLLGHYRIQNPIGAGGMGRVYEAADIKLNRTVAIKFLLPDVVDENSRRRFIREAQVASALNHPNIVTVYDVGNEGATGYIVMERVAGQTLRQLIRNHGLPPRTAVRYACQVASALAAAHEAGVVHRDLKPGNIMITDRDMIKVLDFGLAKYAADLGGNREDSLTAAGRTVGTASYMSPEQAQGKEVDGRSDIFSFGSVLYEMLTGRRAFDGESGMDAIAAVLNTEPPPLSSAIPPSLQRVVQKCLAKKPHDRWQNMADVKHILDDLLADLDSPTSQGGAAPTGRFGWQVVVIAALTAALLSAAALRLLTTGRSAPEPEPTYRMLTADKGLNDYPAISKDGKFIAFASDRGRQENLDIWLQQIGGREPIRLTTDPADETDPDFSPDGTKIVFRSEKNGGGIYIVPTLGGDPVLLAAEGKNPRFSPDGRLVAYWTGRGEGSATVAQIFIVDASGGQPKQIHQELMGAQFPVWSRRGDQLLVYGWNEPRTAAVDWWLLPVDGGKPFKTGAIPRFRQLGLVPQLGLRVELAALEWLDLSGGRAIFAGRFGGSANLWEAGLTQTGSVNREPRRLTSGPGRHAHASWAGNTDNEWLAFSDELASFNIWNLPLAPASGQASGEMIRVTDSLAERWAPSITADGHLVLYVGRLSGTSSLVIKDLTSGRERTLYSTSSFLPNARITGDGQTVFFSTATYDLMSLPAAGGTLERLCEHCGTVTDASFNGDALIYEPIENEDLLMFDVAARKKIVLARRPGPDVILTGGRLSHDGKWVAFHSIQNRTRATQVWIAPVDRNQPAPAGAWIPITDGKAFAQDPCWGPDERLVYFTSERDAFRCFWAQPLDPFSKKPAGEPFPLQHFHSASRTLRGTASTGYLTAASAGSGRVVFSFAEVTGNIWLKETKHAK